MATTTNNSDMRPVWPRVPGRIAQQILLTRMQTSRLQGTQSPQNKQRDGGNLINLVLIGLAFGVPAFFVGLWLAVIVGLWAAWAWISALWAGMFAGGWLVLYKARP